MLVGEPSSNALKDYKHSLGVALIDLNNSRKSESWSHDVDTTNESPPPCDAQYLDNSNCCRCVASLWYMQKEGQVVSTTFPDTVHIIRQDICCCMTTSVVYVMTCQGCMRQYVGKTKKTLAYRHGVHRTEMWEQKSLLGINLVHCYKGKRGFSLKLIEE